MENSLSIKQRLAQPDNVQLVVELLNSDPAPIRAHLTKEVCRRLDLRDPKGDLQIATTAQALRDLEAQGFWRLPEAIDQGPRDWNPSRLDHRVKAAVKVPKKVEDIRGLHLVEVRDQEHLEIWNELMLTEHPLGECRFVGRQLRYLIASDHGWLGGMGFSSAALYLESRDEWIGWEGSQRIEHLERVLNMNRFLIRPRIHCQNLASHVLGLCARTVSGDFNRRYGLRPWMLESFVETPTYDGSCYKAANWIKVGQTKGRGRNGARDEGKSIKDVYLYPLVDDFHDRVGVDRFPLSGLDPESGLDGQGWAEQEFGDCELGDTRLAARLVKIVSDQASQPSGSYAQASGGNRYDVKGYYRLLNNDREEIDIASLLQTHRTQTIRRMKKQERVLIIQDTTDLNLSTRPACEGLGQIGTNQTGTKSLGLKMHSSLALAESGVPLGVPRIYGYAPQSAKGKDPDRPIEEKESNRWLEAFQDAMDMAVLIPDTHVIGVTDREGDMFELFHLQRKQQGTKADLLVRSKWDRCLEDSDQKLFEELAAAPLAKIVTISVPRQREHASKPSTPGRVSLPARSAEVEVRFKEVTLRAPQAPQTKSLAPIRLWAIYLVEKDPPAGSTAVRWMLLTTVQVVSVKQALKVVRWYCKRWRIEEWHRVMKSGCKILEHQNHTAEALMRAIALDAVIAWRIMLLALLGREVPEMRCELLFNPCECQVLEMLAQKKSLTIGEAMIIIAKLGGYLNRKCDGHPGFENLWKGYARFSDMVQIMRLAELDG
jgi:Domain of unknown function (DUF4338)/Transposase DNA-binding/Transposase Tn5 dimerisation domain